MQIVAIILLALLTAGVWFTDWRVYKLSNDLSTEMIKFMMNTNSNLGVIGANATGTSIAVTSIAETLAHGVDARAKIEGAPQLPVPPPPIQPPPSAVQPPGPGDRNWEQQSETCLREGGLWGQGRCHPAVQPPTSVHSPAPESDVRPPPKHHTGQHRQNNSTAEQLYQKIRRQRDEAERGVSEQKPLAQKPKRAATPRDQEDAKSKPEPRSDHQHRHRRDDSDSPR